jgi:hypothetical protein
MSQAGKRRIGDLTSDLAVPFERELLGYALKTAEKLGIEMVRRVVAGSAGTGPRPRPMT